MNKKKAALILGLAVLCMIISGCGVDEIDIGEYRTASIAVDGATEDAKTLYLAQLKEMENVTRKTHSADDKNTEVWATGPLLATVLEAYGASKSDFSAIKIYGRDNDVVTLDKEFLQENDIILAYGINGEPLGQESKPLQIVIPESDSRYWVRMVSRIKCIK